MLERVKASIRFAATEYTSVMITPNTMVPRTPPMAPSTVFFGADHRAELMLAKGTACKVGTGIAAPGKAEDEQDKEHRIIAVLLHRQQLLEPDKGIEAENHDAGEHQQAAGLLIADGAVAHHQIDGVKHAPAGKDIGITSRRMT